MIDYARLAKAGGISKGVPAALLKARRKQARVSLDERESAKVKRRSGWRCELIVDGARCTRRACEVHHLLGGWGVRGRNQSALAANKRHVCKFCHSELHAHLLIQSGRGYRRVR